MRDEFFFLESRKRKVEHSDSDDDDDFYDRTGAVERKRIEKSAVQQNNALSYAELVRESFAILEQQTFFFFSNFLRWNKKLKLLRN